MVYNNFRFTTIAEFKATVDLAIRRGFETAREFDLFLRANYAHLKRSPQV